MIIERTKHYAVCPYCSEDAGEVDHLLGQSLKTAWYCDSCGERYSLTFTPDGQCEVSKCDGRKITTTDVLVLPPQAKPIYFVVEGMRFEGPDCRPEDDQAESKRFYYEEHSCPVNWLKPDMVYFEGDSDPHGLIEFVSHVDSDLLPQDETWSPNDRDRAVIALIEKNR